MVEYISLGTNCAISYQLKKYGLRKEAYPFDWCNVNFKNLLNVLENNFIDYNELEIKKFSTNHLHIDTSIGTYILKNKYGITFAHEVLDNSTLDLFSDTLSRRIERFKNLTDNQTKIVFIRIELEEKIINYDELIKLLENYIQNFKLIIICKNNDNKINDKITYYQLPNFIDWKFDNFNWSNIFL